VFIMGKTAGLVLKEALDLPEQDRFQLVENLLMTLETERDEDIDTAWAAEVERRAQEISQGGVVSLAWEEVKAKAARRAHGDR
jgi:putative addiction module component (TIGR02574 family)